MMLGLKCDSIIKVEAIYGDDEGIVVLLEYGVGDLRSGMRGQLSGFTAPDTPGAMRKLVQQLADPLLYLHSFQQKTAEDKLERNPILHRCVALASPRHTHGHLLALVATAVTEIASTP